MQNLCNLLNTAKGNIGYARLDALVSSRAKAQFFGHLKLL